MNNFHNIEDDFIRDLVRKKGPESPSADFTNNVMSGIEKKGEAASSRLLPPYAWILMGLGLAGLVTVLFMVDVPYIGKIFSGPATENFRPGIIFSDQFLNTMSSFFNSFNFTSISVAILLSAFALIAVDRILRKRVMQSHMLMI
jgi:hypothetical protein